MFKIDKGQLLTIAIAVIIGLAIYDIFLDEKVEELGIKIKGE